MKTSTQKIAVVTGANRGIGKEVAFQLSKKGNFVILGVRDPEKGRALEAEWKGEGLNVHYRKLDIADSASIDLFYQGVMKDFGGVDILVNNAGIMLESTVGGGLDPIRKTFETNCLGPYRMCELFLPEMIKRGFGRIVNVSSGMGQLSEMQGGYPAYRISKTALNAVTRIFAAEAQSSHKDILVNSVCPGWVKTDMGGAHAERPVQKGAETIVWLALLPQGGANGGFFRDQKPIAW